MRVHHVNCATFCPFSEWLVAGEGSPLRPGRMVCHCLVLETDGGLVLVDTGLGTADLADPGRLGRAFLLGVRPRLDPEETAVRQVERLGFRPGDVRHVVLTHLDLDHAGGLADFPGAAVHVLQAEHDAALRRATLNERARYVPAQWAHGPRWTVHEPGGDRWMGFESVRALPEGGDDVLLIPLQGHTRGHCGVAVRTGEGWLLHCGDAYFFRGEVDPVRPHCPPLLAAYQGLLAVDGPARRANRDRLRDLAREQAGSVRLVCAHDPVDLDRLRAAAEAVRGPRQAARG